MKLKLGTLKGKLVAGALAVVVLASAGVAYASTDAGANLKQWYDGMFSTTVDNVEAQTDAYKDSKLPGLAEEYEGLKSDASLDIDLTRTTETGESLEAIVNAKLSHIESLDESQQEILANMGLQFYNVMLDGYFEIERLGEEGLAYATNDLTTYTDQLGQDAVNQLTGDLGTAKDNAVTELEDAVREAKEQLAQELDSNEEITVRNLKNQVDWAIEDLRASVTELLTGLVEEQQTIIVAKAQELEDNAKAALDDVVSGINN